MSGIANDLGGVLCLEGEWGNSLTDGRSVLPVLELLQSTESANFVHRRISTTAEFCHQLEKWLVAVEGDDLGSFTTLFIAAHGNEGILCFDEGEDSEITLDELGEFMNGGARECYVYFGSCGTMSSSDDELQKFRVRSGARAVLGYTEEVDWLTTAAFEALLINEMANSRNGAQLFDRLRENYGSTVEKLGLTVVTSSGVWRA